MPTVNSPVSGFTGTRAGVRFVDGVAETDDPAALAYFRRKGYQIGGGSSGDGYDSWKVAQLREELERREADTDGKKAELVERLRELDADESD